MIFWPARAGRPVYCRAQNDDRPFPQFAAGTAGARAGDQPGPRYYLPGPVSAADLTIMRRIDELHLEFPFAGSRMLRDLLRQEGTGIGRQHVATLMKKMAIEAIYRRPNTSKPTPGHKIYPYLLRKLPIVRPNQVWATAKNRQTIHLSNADPCSDQPGHLSRTRAPSSGRPIRTKLSPLRGAGTKCWNQSTRHLFTSFT
jgi:putative transposase